MAATALARLAALTGRDDLDDLARSTLQAVQLVMEKAPTAAGQSLIALDFLLAPTRGIRRDRRRPTRPSSARPSLAIHERFLPHKVVAPAPGQAPEELAELVPLLADRPAKDGRVTTYICENFACQAPVVGVEALRQAIRLYVG